MQRDKAESLWLGASVTIVLFIALALTNRTLLTDGNFLPYSDFAADILLTQRAEHGWLLTGHYNFRGVNHPGPFFLYLRLAGQWLTQGLTASVFGGQLAGVMASNGLFAGLFAFLLCRLLNKENIRGWPVAAIVLSAVLAVIMNVSDGKFLGAAPFEVYGSALANIWMPYLLILPFMCFMAAVLLLARGSSAGFLVSVFCVCALVHGYIPMPTIVGPIWAGAVVIGWKARRRECGAGFPPSVLAGVVLIIALFLAPILADMLISPPGNLAAIFRVAAQKRAILPTLTLKELARLFGRHWLHLHPVLWLLLLSGLGICLKTRRYDRLLWPSLAVVFMTLATSALTFSQTPGPVLIYTGIYSVAIPTFLAILMGGVTITELARLSPRLALIPAGGLAAACLLTGTLTTTYLFPETCADASRLITSRFPPGSKIAFVDDVSSRSISSCLMLELDKYGIDSCATKTERTFYYTSERVCNDAAPPERVVLHPNRYDCNPGTTFSRWENGEAALPLTRGIWEKRPSHLPPPGDTINCLKISQLP